MGCKKLTYHETLSPLKVVCSGLNISGNSCVGSYRYGFQGQELDNEVKGKGNSVNFKYRMHDPRVGRFFAVDPLTKDYPHYSPYSFSGNKVIAFIEFEGKEEVTFQTYSFAPFERFGGGYKGDGKNRKFGDPISSEKGKENYRIGAKVKLDLSTNTVINKEAFGALSEHMTTGVKAFSDAKIEEFQYTDGSMKMSIAGNNNAFLWGASSDIDVTASISFLVSDDKSDIFVAGWTKGDRFPSNELYLTDKAGKKVFLGVTGADGNPFTSLPGEGEEDMSFFGFSILLDDKENFAGVKTLDGTTYDIDEWNKIFENLDPKDGDTGTNVQLNGNIQTDY